MDTADSEHSIFRFFFASSLRLHLSLRQSLPPSVPLSVCAPSSLNFSHCPVLAVAKTFVPHFIQDISAPHVQFLLVSYFARFRPVARSAFPLPPPFLLSPSFSLFPLLLTPSLPCLALCPAAVQGAYKFNSLLFVSLLGSSFSGLEIFKIS